MPNNYFQFQQFTIYQDQCAMKVGTDGVLLGAWADHPKGIHHRILDIGTGTGLLALMMAQRFPNMPIDAVEIDPNACQQAQYNFNQSSWGNRIHLYQQDFKNFATTSSSQYDCIISNPPYFQDALHSPNPARTIARHTNSLPFEVLLNGIKRLLLPNGVVNLILPYIQLDIFLLKARFAGLYCSHQYRIKTSPKKGFKRVLLRFSLEKTVNCSIQELVMGNGRNIPYAEEYQALTGDFYL